MNKSKRVVVRKLIVVGFVVVAVVVIGSGLYVYTKNKDDKSMEKTDTQSTSESTSINALLAQNKNLTCTYSSTDAEGNINTGSIYISGKKLRGTFSTQAGGQAAKTGNVVRDDTYQYVWAEGQSSGIKAQISVLATSASPPSSAEGANPNANYDFNCDSWKVDNKLFVAPKEVTFTDYTQQLQQAPQDDSQY